MEQILKSEIHKALLARDEISKNILRLVLGEIQLKESSTKLSTAEHQAIIRKIIKSNQETIARLLESNRPDDVLILLKEIDILKAILPKDWDSNKIHQFIKDKNIDVISPKNEGQAIGAVMKALKVEPDAVIDPAIVKVVVIELRN